MIIESTIFHSPMRLPSREFSSTCGDALMFSCPPAMTISASPQRPACAASITAFSPEPQTLLIVMPGQLFAPRRPPAAVDALRRIEPGLRIRREVRGPEIALALGRRVDHAGNVAAGAEHESGLATEKARARIGRLPRHDVVLARG